MRKTLFVTYLKEGFAMKTVYHYQVIYIDDYGHKHLHFCEGRQNVQRLRDRYEVQEVQATKYVAEANKEKCYC